MVDYAARNTYDLNYNGTGIGRSTPRTSAGTAWTVS
jgi:hypothetical protein